MEVANNCGNSDPMAVHFHYSDTEKVSKILKLPQRLLEAQ